jgi:hypothetical protein
LREAKVEFIEALRGLRRRAELKHDPHLVVAGVPESVPGARRHLNRLPCTEHPLGALDAKSGLSSEDLEVLVLVRMDVLDAGEPARREGALGTERRASGVAPVSKNVNRWPVTGFSIASPVFAMG